PSWRETVPNRRLAHSANRRACLFDGHSRALHCQGDEGHGNAAGRDQAAHSMDSRLGFNWQDRYTYKSPVLLPKGTKIDVSLLYDNSAGNRRNPSSPPKRVTWGEESFD